MSSNLKTSFRQTTKRDSEKLNLSSSDVGTFTWKDCATSRFQIRIVSPITRYYVAYNCLWYKNKLKRFHNKSVHTYLDLLQTRLVLIFRTEHNTKTMARACVWVCKVLECLWSIAFGYRAQPVVNAFRLPFDSNAIVAVVGPMHLRSWLAKRLTGSTNAQNSANCKNLCFVCMCVCLCVPAVAHAHALSFIAAQRVSTWVGGTKLQVASANTNCMPGPLYTWAPVDVDRRRTENAPRTTAHSDWLLSATALLCTKSEVGWKASEAECLRNVRAIRIREWTGNKNLNAK